MESEARSLFRCSSHFRMMETIKSSHLISPTFFRIRPAFNPYSMYC